MSAHAHGCRSLMWLLVVKDAVHHCLLVATSQLVTWHLVLVLKMEGDEGAHTCGQGVGLGSHDMEVVTRQRTTSVIVDWVWATYHMVGVVDEGSSWLAFLICIAWG